MSKLAILGGQPVRTAKEPGWPRVRDADRQGLADVYLSGQWSKGKVTDLFEQRFSDRTGVRHSVLVSNGTAALEMILRGLGIGYGDEVILPPYTFIATLSSVLFVGATPVFADIDPETYNIAAKAAEQRITGRTKAIIAVAVGGCPPDLDALSALADKQGMHLIVDAAQAVGAKWDSKDIAGFGIAASFSCQNTKNLTCGEGGIITTNNSALYDSIVSMQNGTDPNYYTDNQVTEFQSSLLTTQLDKLDEEIMLREQRASYLDDRLKHLPFVHQMRRDPKVTVHANHLYVMRLDKDILAEKGLTRDMFIEAVNHEGVALADGYRPLYTFPCVTSARVEKMIGRKIDVSPHRHCERAANLEGAWLYQANLLGGKTDMDAIAAAFDKVWANAGPLVQCFEKRGVIE